MKILSFFLVIINLIYNVFGISTSDRIVAGNTVFDVECRSDISCPPDDVWDNGAQYPTMIELNHNGNNNGVLLATNEIFKKGVTNFEIMESKDKGEHWNKIATIIETKTENLMAAWEPCLYELPSQIGDYPEGTVILGEVSLDDGCKSVTQLSVFASTDCGYTWEEISIVDTAGGIDKGIWEPNFVYDNGYLYCFYSDDSDEICSQTIVYKRTSDLVNWSDKVQVVRSNDPGDRPGMPVVTRLGNGMYYLAFEYLTSSGDNTPIRYKITDDISQWNASDIGTEIYTSKGDDIHASPSCIWFPQGGKNGTLIVGGKYGTRTKNGKLLRYGRNELFVSSDYGKTYKLMNNPLPYSDMKGFGYSSYFFYSESNELLYYTSAVDYKDNLSKIQFARIKPTERWCIY